MSRDKVKNALVGAGGWGIQHARVLSQHQDAEFCAIAGRTLEKTKARAERFGVPYYLDIQEMLGKEQPDLVNVCLPNKGHFEPTLQIIQAGYPLFVEKPLVFKIEEADTLLDEAAEGGLFFAINFNHRYARPVQMAFQAIREGRLGTLVFATWRFGGEGGDCREDDNLIETQCHGFDVLEYLCGPIESVMAQMTDVTGKGFSNLAAALHFAGGAVGSLVGSYDSSYAYSGTHQLEINGTGGRVLVEDTVRSFSFQRAGIEVAEVWRAGYFNDADRQFHQTIDKHYERVMEAFWKGAEPPVHARAGRRALVPADATIRSFEMGKRVVVDE